MCPRGRLIGAWNGKTTLFQTKGRFAEWARKHLVRHSQWRWASAISKMCARHLVTILATMVSWDLPGVSTSSSKCFGMSVPTCDGHSRGPLVGVHLRGVLGLSGSWESALSISLKLFGIRTYNVVLPSCAQCRRTLVPPAVAQAVRHAKRKWLAQPTTIVRHAMMAIASQGPLARRARAIGAVQLWRCIGKDIVCAWGMPS